MEIKQSNYEELEVWLNRLEDEGANDELFESAVEEHFCNLPKNNNGNILSFMESSFRYFEINNNKQMGGYQYERK